MSPGGHLVTTTIACAGAAVLTGSWAATAAVAAGGFFIDVDHAADYVLIERDRRLTPDAFLRHYLEGRTRRTVLVLHSYELLAPLGLTFNGEVTPRSIVAFYSFAYRLAHRFDARRLLGSVDFEPAPAGFWAAFFAGGRVAGVLAKPPLARTWPRSKSSC